MRLLIFPGPRKTNVTFAAIEISSISRFLPATRRNYKGFFTVVALNKLNHSALWCLNSSPVSKRRGKLLDQLLGYE